MGTARCATLSSLHLPWVQEKNHRNPERFTKVAKLNYKVYAYLGLHTQFMIRVLTGHDKIVGSSWVVESVLPQPVQAQIRTNATPNITGSNKNQLKTVGPICLVVTLGHLVVKVDFIVCRSLAAPLILVCDCCDIFVKAICPRLKQMMLEDGTVVPIVPQPLKCATKHQVLLLAV